MKYIKSIDSNNTRLTALPRCCENSLLTHIDKKKFNVSCPLDKIRRDKGKYCENTFKQFSIFDYHQENDTISKKIHSKANRKSIFRRGYDYCVGPTHNFFTQNPDEIIQMELFECKAVCNGQRPCLRYVSFSHLIVGYIPITIFFVNK